MLKTKQVDDNMIVYLKGRLDATFTEEVEEQLNQLLEENPDSNIIMNFNEVEYLSSSAMRVLIATMRYLKENKKTLKLCNLNYAVRKLFEIVELTEVFDIFDSERRALKGH